MDRREAVDSITSATNRLGAPEISHALKIGKPMMNKSFGKFLAVVFDHHENTFTVRSIANALPPINDLSLPNPILVFK